MLKPCKNQIISVRGRCHTCASAASGKLNFCPCTPHRHRWWKNMFDAFDFFISQTKRLDSSVSEELWRNGKNVTAMDRGIKPERVDKNTQVYNKKCQCTLERKHTDRIKTLRTSCVYCSFRWPRKMLQTSALGFARRHFMLHKVLKYDTGRILTKKEESMALQTSKPFL